MSKEVRPTAIIMNTPLTCFDTCFDEEDLLCPASQRITSKAWMQETPYPILPPVDALPCANETALPTEPEAKESNYLTYQPLDPEEALQYAVTYQAAKELMEEEEAFGAQMLCDKQRMKGYSYGIPEVDFEREWMPQIHAHVFRLRAYTMAFECMAPPGVVDPLK